MPRQILPLIIAAAASLAGCTSSRDSVPQRSRLTLDEITIALHGPPRSFMFSDKHGAFLVGHISPGSPGREQTWSIGGIAVPGIRRLNAGSVDLSDALLDSVRVRPDCLTRFYRGGTTELMAVLEHPEQGGDGVHEMLIEVRSSGDQDVELVVARKNLRRTGNASRYETLVPGAGILTIAAGDGSAVTDSSIAVRRTRVARFRFTISPVSSSTRDIPGDPDSLLAQRSSRMENLLNRSYIRTSDPSLTRALCWMKLSLDAMLIEQTDTFVVAGIPWDGSLGGRENAQSIAGIGLATGDYQKTASIVRTLARWQDLNPASTTYGRIPDRVDHGRVTYGGADVGPWFVREMYEHVVYANDTSLVRSLYPVVKRGIEGTLKYHTDADNFLVHGDGETWMSARDPATGALSFVPRGNRAVEVQLLWYFQQLIGSYIASYVNDTSSSALWDARARKTSSAFNGHFVDTVANSVFDHLNVQGKGVAELRPNALYCLEILGSEAVQEQMIKTLINHLVYPNGCSTLDAGDPRFHGVAGRNAEGIYNGPIWTWLAGQLVYTLSRYDRQDFSYQITESMVRQLGDRGMVGALPAMMDVVPRNGAVQPTGEGYEASATGMAEFIRAFYQDYLGLRIDVPSNQITLQPKLPDFLTDVDFTVYFGQHPVNGRFEKREDISRIVLSAPTIRKPVRVGFLWMLNTGDAWRASANLPPDSTLTIVIGKDDVLGYHGDRQVQLVSPTKLKKFSLRESFTGFDFAPTPKR